MVRTENPGPGLAVVYVFVSGLVALAVFSVAGGGSPDRSLLVRLAESPNVFVGLMLVAFIVGVVLNYVLSR